MQTAIKGEIDSNTIIVGGFNTALTSMDRSSRQKISKETQAISNTLDHPKAAEYTFFSGGAHGTFSRIGHMLGHKASLGKFKKTEIISSVFSNHNTMRLEINNRKNLKKKQTQTRGG